MGKPYRCSRTGRADGAGCTGCAVEALNTPRSRGDALGSAVVLTQLANEHAVFLFSFWIAPPCEYWMHRVHRNPATCSVHDRVRPICWWFEFHFDFGPGGRGRQALESEGPCYDYLLTGGESGAHA